MKSRDDKKLGLEAYESLILMNRIISIIGESATGKTTLALQLISNLMINCDKDSGKTVWIQASEKFPQKRLINMYQNQPEIATRLLKNIFIIPKYGPFPNKKSQANFFRNFESLVLPPGIKYIVIDNISHHLRYSQGNISKVQEKMKFMNKFFNQELFPLIMFCLREKFYLFLIHEVSFDPRTGESRAYNNQLFERVKGVKICLTKSIGTKLNKMYISTDDEQKQFVYEISDQGLAIL